MVEKIKKSQEEEIEEFLALEGFVELSEEAVASEPYRTIFSFPKCMRPGGGTKDLAQEAAQQ